MSEEIKNEVISSAEEITQNEELKAGDIIIADQGEVVELDAEQATDLNEQISEVVLEETKEEVTEQVAS